MAKPSAVWKAIEPLLTGAVTARTTVRPLARATAKKRRYRSRAEAGPAPGGVDADEVDVGLVGVIGAQEADEEADERVLVLGHAATWLRKCSKKISRQHGRAGRGRPTTRA